MITIIFILILIPYDALVIGNGRDYCRERDRLIQSDLDDLYTLIDATLEENVAMQCHYCDEMDDGRPKNWYKLGDLGEAQPREVELDMNNNSSENRIRLDSQHTLTIHNVMHKDLGLYYCQRYEGEQQEKYNYLVHLVTQENITDEIGNLTHWGKYFEEHFVHINILFKESEGIEFRYIRDQLKIDMEMVTEWGSWGICEVCGRAQNDGIRRKTGYCRIKLKNNALGKIKQGRAEEKFFRNANMIGCRSEILQTLYPGISNLTRIIPNFIQIQKCEGKCNPDAEGVNQGWKTGKSSTFKYRKRFTLAQNAHLTLICPESSLENKITWRRNGKVLEPGEGISPEKEEEEPKIFVDTFNTLYLVDVTQAEEGNYTCQVDDIKMQQVIIFVKPNSRILTEAFVRHMSYLGLVLSLTVPCYCAGIVVTCHRRRFFKDYETLKEEEAEKKGPFRYTQLV